VIKAMNHVGLSVANLDRSVEFYRDLLGMEVVENETFEGPLYDQILGLTGVAGRVALLRYGAMQIELFEFLKPHPRLADPNRPVCDHGITHLCIEVVGIDSVYARLCAAGTRFHCPPLDFDSARATYGRDPDGNVFELLEIVRADNGTPERSRA
jgi:catechol 2,3-dioxygenase-like lactoylglutathione lyase family enzyme